MKCPFCKASVPTPSPENDDAWEMSEGEWVPYPCPSCGKMFKLSQHWKVSFHATKPKKDDDMTATDDFGHKGKRIGLGSIK